MFAVLRSVTDPKLVLMLYVPEKFEVGRRLTVLYDSFNVRDVRSLSMLIRLLLQNSILILLLPVRFSIVTVENLNVDVELFTFFNVALPISTTSFSVLGRLPAVNEPNLLMSETLPV